MADSFLLKRTTMQAKNEMTKCCGIPNTKSGKMVNIINYATSEKPTKKYSLPTNKPDKC